MLLIYYRRRREPPAATQPWVPGGAGGAGGGSPPPPSTGAVGIATAGAGVAAGGVRAVGHTGGTAAGEGDVESFMTKLEQVSDEIVKKGQSAKKGAVGAGTNTAEDTSAEN